MSKQKIELTIPADLKFSSLVRRISEDFFLYIGFTNEWANRLKLVVDELFMNANRYGSKTNESKVFISYGFDNNEVICRVEDEGNGERRINADELKKRISKNSTEARDLTKTNGRGLALISSLWTDHMIIENSNHGGLAVSFSKKISSEMPPAPAPSLGTVTKPEETKGLTEVSPVVPKGPTEVIKISGEIDHSNMVEKTQPIVDMLNKIPPESVLVLDCSELIYINSTFIGHLAEWLNQLRLKNGQLVLRSVKKQVKEVLDLVGISKVIYLES